MNKWHIVGKLALDTILQQKYIEKILGALSRSGSIYGESVNCFSHYRCCQTCPALPAAAVFSLLFTRIEGSRFLCLRDFIFVVKTEHCIILEQNRKCWGNSTFPHLQFLVSPLYFAFPSNFAVTFQGPMLLFWLHVGGQDVWQCQHIHSQVVSFNY